MALEWRDEGKMSGEDSLPLEGILGVARQFQSSF